MTGRVGINSVGSGFSNEPSADWVNHQLKPRSSIVIDEVKRAQLYLQGVERVIFRVSDDDMAFLKYDPVDFANRLHHTAPAGCWIYGGNEFGSGELEKQNDWSLRFVNQCVVNGRKPLIHNQSLQNPYTSADIRKLSTSTQAAMQAGGGVGQHVYYYPTIDAEKARKPRNSFDNINDWRQIFGVNLYICIGEFGMAWNYDPHDGQFNHIGEEEFANHTIQYASMLDQNIDLLIYGEFRDGSEWESFNIRNRSIYKERIATWNKENPIVPPATTCPPVESLGTPVPGKVTWVNADFVNVRASCSSSSADLGDLRLNDAVTFRPTKTAVINNNAWWRVEAPIAGWASAEVSTIEKTVVPPEPPPSNGLTYSTEQIESMANAAELIIRTLSLGVPSDSGDPFP